MILKSINFLFFSWTQVQLDTTKLDIGLIKNQGLYFELDICPTWLQQVRSPIDQTSRINDRLKSNQLDNR